MFQFMPLFLILFGTLEVHAAGCADLFTYALQRESFFRVESKASEKEYAPEELLRLAEANPNEFLQEMNRLFSEYQRFRARAEDAIRHPLTKLYNRRALEEIGQRIFDQAAEKGYSVAVLSIDSNKFKQINDRLSHARGDQHLHDIAGLLYWVVVKSVMRETDFVFHSAGDEFHIILQGADLEGARIVAKRITDAVAEAPFVQDIAQKILVATQGDSPLAQSHRATLKQALGPNWKGIVQSGYVGTLTVGVATRKSVGGIRETLLETLHRADADLEAQKTLRSQRAQN